MSSGNNAVPYNTIILGHFFVPFLSTALDFRRTQQWRLYGEAEGATVTRILASLYPVGQKKLHPFFSNHVLCRLFFGTQILE